MTIEATVADCLRDAKLGPEFILVVLSASKALTQRETTLQALCQKSKLGVQLTSIKDDITSRH